MSTCGCTGRFHLPIPYYPGTPGHGETAPSLRVGTSAREAWVRHLRACHAQGMLSDDELASRTQAVREAVHAGEAVRVLRDLPPPMQMLLGVLPDGCWADDRLRERYRQHLIGCHAEGRMDAWVFEARMAAVDDLRTGAELRALVTDLPSLPPEPEPKTPSPPSPPASPAGQLLLRVFLQGRQTSLMILLLEVGAGVAALLEAQMIAAICVLVLGVAMIVVVLQFQFAVEAERKRLTARMGGR